MQKSPCCQRQVALHSACTDPAQMTSENMVASLGNKKAFANLPQTFRERAKKIVTNIQNI